MTFHMKISLGLKHNFARSFRSEISIKVLDRDLQMHKTVWRGRREGEEEGPKDREVRAFEIEHACQDSKHY